jgi:hypothetical protein
MKAQAAIRLDPSEHAILAMRLAGHTLADIGETLSLPAPAITERIAAIVTALVFAGTSDDRRPELAPAWSAA